MYADLTGNRKKQRIKSLCGNNVSLANSLRTLKAYAAAVQTQIGVGLASAIRHVIVWLNEMMKYVLKAAQAFATFMQTIFGKYKGGASGIAIEGLGDAADYADDLGSAADDAASGLGDAADSAKQLKKDLSVLPFDELNQLNKDQESASSGSGSGGTGGGSVGAGGIGDGLLDWDGLVEEAYEGSAWRATINAWATRLKKDFLMHDWEGLGADIADGLNKGLKKVYDLLDPKVIHEKVFPWIDAFTTTFNSFVENFDWNLLGRTIGRGINDIVDILYRGITGIDWNLLGRKCADGINGLFDEVNFENVGKLVGAKFMAFWNWLNGFVHELDWDGLGTSIADFFNGLFEDISFSTIADTIATGLNGAFDSLASFTERFNWEDLADNIGNGIITFISEFEWKENGQKLGDFLQKLANTLATVVGDVDWEDLGNGMADFLAGIEWEEILPKVGSAICTALGGIMKGMLKNPEGTFALAVIAGLGLLKFSHSSFGRFTGNLVEAITGSTPKTLIKLAFQKLFGTSVKDAAESTVVKSATKAAGGSIMKSFTSALSGTSGVVAQFGAITLAVGGAAAAIYGLTRWVDKLQGGNGKITESGEALEAYIERIGEAASLSREQVDTLWLEIEDMESAGYDTATMIEHVRDRLDEWGVSTEEQYAILQMLNAEGVTSKDVLDEMAASYEKTGQASAAYSEDVDAAFDTIIDVLYDARDATDNFDSRYEEAIKQLTASRGDFHSIQDVINATINIMESLGLETDGVKDAFDEMSGNTVTDVQNVESATKTSSLNISQAVKDAKEAVSSRAQEMKDKIHETVNSWGSAEEATTSFKDKAKSNLSAALSAISNYESGAKTSLSNNKSHFNDLDINSVKSMASMITQVKAVEAATLALSISTKMHASSISGHFNTAFTDIRTSVNSLVMGVEAGMRQMQSVISYVASNMASSFNTWEMYNVGQSMGQALANGFSSIHVPMPHMYVSWWNMVSFGDGGYMYYPEFGLSWYRAGGLFKGGDGQIIGIGENNRDEAVLPLEDHRAMSRIGSAIAEAGGMNNGANEQFINRIAERLADIIMMSQDKEQTPMFNITVRTESDEVLARAVTRGQQKLDYRNNPTPSYGY